MDPSDFNQTHYQFQERFGSSPSRSDLDLKVLKRTDENEICVVFFLVDEKGGKVGMKGVKDKVEPFTQTEGTRTIILVVEHGLSGAAQSTLQSINSEMPDLSVQFFKDSELVVDITEHELVPKHELLSPKEKETLLNRYKLKESQLPKIQDSDPVARYYGLKRGDVVKIIRESETAGKYVTYRICVDSVGH